MASALEYVILAHNDEAGKTSRKLLMFNGTLPSLDPRFYAQLVDLAPMPEADGKAGAALVLVDYDGPRMLLAAIQPTADSPTSFTEHYVFMPAARLRNRRCSWSDGWHCCRSSRPISTERCHCCSRPTPFQLIANRERSTSVASWASCRMTVLTMY